MKQCPACNELLNESYNFCMKCGFNIKKYEEENRVKFCPNCGAKAAGGKFCVECGFNIGDIKTVSSNAPKSAGEKSEPKKAEEPEEPKKDTSVKGKLAEAVKESAEVTLGEYPQDKDGGKKPIVWKILKKEDNSAWLISKYSLDWKQYHTEKKEVTWETCALRAWLNGDFFATAFTYEEKAAIATVNLENSANGLFGTAGGNNTDDRVFLLSEDEAKKFFLLKSERAAQMTDYAKGKCKEMDGDADKPWWWLRSPGGNQTFAAKVENTGSISAVGYFVNDYDNVRPVIKVTF